MTKDEVIEKIQEQVAEKYEAKVLHILNGGAMLEDFKQNGRMKGNFTYVPFNEAMCWGEADEEVFSAEFIKKRVESLNTTEEDYRKIVMEPLEPLFKDKFNIIVMWFGDDMFCQINMLTVLGFLEQVGYEGGLLFCMVHESTDEILPDAHEMILEGSLEKYRSIVCNRKMPSCELLPFMYQGASLYLSYRSETSEISRYIIQNLNKQPKELISELLQTFPKYGLGDLQYEMMIKDHQIKTIL